MHHRPSRRWDKEGMSMTEDNVNHPSHYAEGRKYEPIAVIEAWGLGFNLGNALKYVSRVGRKDDPLEDLEKARWYIDRELSRPLLGRMASRLSRWILRRKVRGRIDLNGVTTDWGMSSNLSFIVASIHDGRRIYLRAAMALIEEEMKRWR